VGESGEVIFMGAGRVAKDGSLVKNVLVIGRDGSVTRMTVDGVKLISKQGIVPRVLGRIPGKGDPEVLINAVTN